MERGVRVGRVFGGRLGFTFLEMLIVVSVLGVIMAVTIPVMRGFNDSNKLRSAAREMISLAKYARMEAVLNRRVTQMMVDIEKRQFWIDLRQPDPKTGEVRPERTKTQFEQKRDLPQDIRIEEVSAYNSSLLGDKLLIVEFFADGTANPFFLTLANRGDERLTLELLKATGQMESSGGTIAERKEAQRAALSERGSL